jgi:hypothetical protein
VKLYGYIVRNAISRQRFAGAEKEYPQSKQDAGGHRQAVKPVPERFAVALRPFALFAYEEGKPPQGVEVRIARLAAVQMLLKQRFLVGRHPVEQVSLHAGTGTDGFVSFHGPCHGFII